MKISLIPKITLESPGFGLISQDMVVLLVPRPFITALTLCPFPPPPKPISYLPEFPLTARGSKGCPPGVRPVSAPTGLPWPVARGPPWPTLTRPRCRCQPSLPSQGTHTQGAARVKEFAGQRRSYIFRNKMDTSISTSTSTHQPEHVPVVRVPVPYWSPPVTFLTRPADYNLTRLSKQSGG